MAVYFAESCGYLKIGYSKDPIGRSTTITRTGTRPDDVPFDAEVDLIGWIPGRHWEETAVQARYIDRRVAGEWFKGIDLEEIKALIWADPRGVDFKGMSMLAVMGCLKYPELTRDELAAATGIQIEGNPDVAGAIDAVFAEVGLA